MFTKREGSLDLRPMVRSDISSAVNLIAMHDEEDAEEAAATYSRSIQNQFCLWDAGSMIGVCGFKPIENTDRAFAISWTYLHPTHRRSGKGSKMLRWILEIVREQGGRKVFVNTSDYQDPEAGDIYRDARQAYQEVGFVEELRHRDFYEPGESMISLGLRLEERDPVEVEMMEESIRLTDVDEIPETDDNYWLSWEIVPLNQESKPADFQRVQAEVKSWGGRSIFMAFPTDLPHAHALMTAAGFRFAGRLIDYFEDGIDEVHFRCVLVSGE